MTSYKMLVLDIDGTLLNSAGRISPRVRQAVTRARHSGMLVTLATGRNLRAALPVANALELDSPQIVSNGALVISPVTEQVFLHRPLKRSLAVQSAQLLQRMGFTVFANRFALTGPDLFHEDTPSLPEQRTLLNREPEYVRQVYDLAGQVAAMEPLKVMTIDHISAVQNAAERLRQRLTGDFQVIVTDEAPGYSLLEVAPAGITKATGIECLAELQGISPAEIIAFGDNYNDLEMLQYAGLGVAMGNAPDAVKRVAAMVTATNDEDGVALFLERHAFAAA